MPFREQLEQLSRWASMVGHGRNPRQSRRLWSRACLKGSIVSFAEHCTSIEKSPPSVSHNDGNSERLWLISAKAVAPKQL